MADKKGLTAISKESINGLKRMQAAKTEEASSSSSAFVGESAGGVSSSMGSMGSKRQKIDANLGDMKNEVATALYNYILWVSVI